MPRIDIGAVLADKAPRLARWIPGFVIGWLRRTIHESEINYILEHYWNLPPQEFIRACFREWQVTYTVEGLEKLDPKGRYLFAANHPFGGMDGMMLADKLIDRFGDARVVVNDLLMHLEPLRPLWIPVNKHGSQNSAYARKFDEEFVGEVPILTFPAGLCSRCIGRGDRPAVENQLPEKGLRFAARDRAGVRRRTAVELLLPRGPAARDAGAEAQYRDALAARRNVFPKGPALPHFRGRPDSRLRAAALRRTPRAGRIRTQKGVFFGKYARAGTGKTLKSVFLPQLYATEAEKI